MANIIHAIRESKSLLTVEAIENGKAIGRICDLDGKPLGRDEGAKQREVYLDAYSGAHYVRITHTQKEHLIKRGEGSSVYQGVGEVHGWFIAAPDFTLEGRYGDGPPSDDHVEHVETIEA